MKARSRKYDLYLAIWLWLIAILCFSKQSKCMMLCPYRAVVTRKNGIYMKDLINDVFISMHASWLMKESVCTRRGINISAMLIIYTERRQVLLLLLLPPCRWTFRMSRIRTRDRPCSCNQTKASRLQFTELGL